MSQKHLKVTIIGDARIGKTLLVKNKFDPDTMRFINGDDIYHIHLFCTEGQEEYERLRPLAYEDTQIFLGVWATHESQQNLENKWIPEVKSHCPGAFVVKANLVEFDRDWFNESPVKLAKAVLMADNCEDVTIEKGKIRN